MKLMSAEVTGVSDSRHLRPKQTQHRRRAKTKASAEKRANQLERMRAGDGGDTFVPRPLVGAGMDVTCLFRVRSRSRVFSAPGRARAWCARARACSCVVTRTVCGGRARGAEVENLSSCTRL